MRTVLVTRPEPDGRRVAAALAAQGVPWLLWPLTEIRRLVDHVELPQGTEALLFTSAHGVRTFAAACPERGLPTLCVGDRTAEIARAERFASVSSAGGDALALAALAARSGHRRFFHPHGQRVAADLSAMLAPGGHDVRGAVIYEAAPVGQVPQPVNTALSEGRVGVLGIWSPRHGELFAGFARNFISWRLENVHAVAISAAAAAPLAGLDLAAVEVAETPTGAAMLRNLIRLAQ